MQTKVPMLLPGKEEISSDIAAKTALLLLAVGINAFEYFLPRIPVFPWLKPGLANIVTIVWIVRWGAADALVYTVVRSWITSYFFGFSIVSFMLSLSGGFLAAAGMGALWAVFGQRGWLGLAGLGIAGAVFHNTGQLCGIYLLLAALPALWYQVPFMLCASLVFGGMTGFIAHALLPLLTKETMPAAPGIQAPSGNIRARFFAGCALLAAGAGIAFVRPPAVLAVFALVATALAFAAEEWKFRVFLFPVRRFWVLFVFVGVMYLFFSYGRTVAGLSFVTHEGVRETLLQWLRLWAWIELSLVLSKLAFNRAALIAAARRVPFGRDTVIAALFALELFPAFVSLLKPRPKMSGAFRILRDPAGMTVSFFGKFYRDILGLVGAGAVGRDARQNGG
jgi:heptaprenyl diphosphate synthase